MDQRNQFQLLPRSHLARSWISNRQLVCGFFKTGRTCRAGDRCPFAHEITKHSNPPRRMTSFSDPNPDPVTAAFLLKAANMGPLDPPRDQTIKTLYIRLLNSSVNEEHLRDRFSPYGEIESIVYFAIRGARRDVSCAFLTYTTRQAAEKAMLELSSWVVVNGQRLALIWGGNRFPKDAEQVGAEQVVVSNLVKPYNGSSWELNNEGGEVPRWARRGFASSELKRIQ